jgi:hypothetical protein
MQGYQYATPPPRHAHLAPYLARHSGSQAPSTDAVIEVAGGGRSRRASTCHRRGSCRDDGVESGWPKDSENGLMKRHCRTGRGTRRGALRDFVLQTKL